METVIFKDFFPKDENGRYSNQPRYVLSSEGRKFAMTGNCCPPKKGDFFLRPSGVKGVFQICNAQQDHKWKCYAIVRLKP